MLRSIKLKNYDAVTARVKYLMIPILSSVDDAKACYGGRSFHLGSVIHTQIYLHIPRV
jgi:hypothetical protein